MGEGHGVPRRVRPAEAGEQTVDELGPALMGEVIELGRGCPEAGPPVEVRHERRVRRHTHHYRLCEADLTRRVVIPENTEVGAPQAGSPARLGYVASSTRPAVRAPWSSTPRMPSTFATATQGSQ